MGEFQPENLNIDPEEIAKNYAEQIRGRIFEFKKNHLKDVNFENIDPNDLDYEDLIIADKLKKRELTQEELDKYGQIIHLYREQKKNEDKNFSPLLDSRSNFYEWAINKFVSLSYERKHPEKPHKELGL